MNTPPVARVGSDSQRVELRDFIGLAFFPSFLDFVQTYLVLGLGEICPGGACSNRTSQRAKTNVTHSWELVDRGCPSYKNHSLKHESHRSPAGLVQPFGLSNELMDFRTVQPVYSDFTWTP